MTSYAEARFYCQRQHLTQGRRLIVLVEFWALTRYNRRS